MIDNIRYWFLLLIDWKIELLKKFRRIVSGEYKYTLSDKELEKQINKWRHTRGLRFMENQPVRSATRQRVSAKLEDLITLTNH